MQEGGEKDLTDYARGDLVRNGAGLHLHRGQTRTNLRKTKKSPWKRRVVIFTVQSLTLCQYLVGLLIFLKSSKYLKMAGRCGLVDAILFGCEPFKK